MSIFGYKKEEELEEDTSPRKIKDLNPENRKRRKEPTRSWGKKERFWILAILLVTVLISGFLALSARNYKLPGLPRISLPQINLGDLFDGETIIIGKKVTPSDRINQEKAERIIAAFKQKTGGFSGVYALSLIDLKSGFSFGVNATEEMTAASLIKLPVLVTLYREYERGNIDLETKYALKNSDKIAGSGSLAGRSAGTVLTYRELAKAIGKESDNTAFGIIRRVLGDENINQLMKDIGLAKTNLTTNTTTPREIGILFQKLWNKEIVSEKNQDEVLNFLTETIYENWIKAGIPEDVRVAHKYGREIHVVNDAGIVFSKDPFVLVIMTDGVVEREADEVIPQLAKMVYSEYVKDPNLY